MKSTTTSIVVALLIVGCADSSEPTRPAPASTTHPVTQPALQAVDLREGVYLARLVIHTTITPEGRLRSVRTENKSYGPTDIDPKLARIEIREGQLSPQQMAELAAMFAGWDSLAAGYPGVPDGPELQFRYGEKTVAGGGAPQQVWNVRRRIDEIAAGMPVVER